MGKVLGSWSGMRKYLEQEMLAESLRGRVRYHCTHYPNLDWSVFEFFMDGQLVKRFSWETVNNYFIHRVYEQPQERWGTMEYWSGFTGTLDSTPMAERTEYTDDEFARALARYRNQPIESSLKSEDDLEAMFAILDRRVGKRTLARISGDFQQNRPEWLRELFRVRWDAEFT